MPVEIKEVIDDFDANSALFLRRVRDIEGLKNVANCAQSFLTFEN